MGEKGEGFTGTVVNDTWTITRWGCGSRAGRWGGLGWWRGMWRKGRTLYMNNNKKCFKKYKNKIKCKETK